MRYESHPLNIKINDMENNITIQLPIIDTCTEEVAVQEMVAGLVTLVKLGAIKGPVDDILLNYEVNLKARYTKAFLKEDALIDASKLNTIGASKIFEVPKEYMTPVDLSEYEKTFSTSTIQERLRIGKMDKKSYVRQLIADYKRYYDTKKNEFQKDPKKFLQFKRMFFNDLMGIINDILPDVVNGKQIGSLMGLSQISSSLLKVGMDLSLAFMQTIKQKKSSGQVNKTYLQKLEGAWNNFSNQLSDIIFKDHSKFASEANDDSYDNSNLLIQQLVMGQSQNLSNTGKYSCGSDGRLKLFSDNKKRIKLFK